MVNDFESAALKGRILIFERVEAVRACGQDAVKIVAREVFNVFDGGCLVEVFLAEATSKFCVAAFFGHDGEVDACGPENLHHRAGDFAGAAVIARSASHPVEHVVVPAFFGNGQVEILRPVKAFIRVKPPGVTDRGSIFKRSGCAFGEFTLLERQVAAHGDDEVGRLNLSRANARTGPAGCAGEKLITRDDITDERLAAACAAINFSGSVTQLHDDRAGLERSARAHGRTNGIAAAAFGAAVERCAIAPRQLFDLGKAERLLLFNVFDLRQTSDRGRFPDIDRYRRAIDVSVIGERNSRDESERRNAMNGPDPDMGRFKSLRAEHAQQKRGADRAHGRVVDPERLLHSKAKPFDKVARDDDEGERKVRAKEALVARQIAGRNVASPDADGDGCKNGYACSVKHKLVDQVDVALQELFAEDIVTDVPVKRRSGCAEEEEEEAEHKNGMHAAGRRFTYALLENDFIHQSISAALICRQRFRRTALPALDVFPNPPRAKKNGEDPEDVDADLSPERHVPEGGPNRHVDGQWRSHCSQIY